MIFYIEIMFDLIGLFLFWHSDNFTFLILSTKLFREYLRNFGGNKISANIMYIILCA